MENPGLFIFTAPSSVSGHRDQSEQTGHSYSHAGMITRRPLGLQSQYL